MNERPALDVLRLHDVLLLCRPACSSGFTAKIVEASQDAIVEDIPRVPAITSPSCRMELTARIALPTMLPPHVPGKEGSSSAHVG